MPRDLCAEARQICPNLRKGIPFVYILRLRSGLLYTGSSIDFEIRFREHQSATACHTTRLDPPVALLWIEIQPDVSAARKREARNKRWSRAKKQAFISGDM